jgi:hypothetical protein
MDPTDVEVMNADYEVGAGEEGTQKGRELYDYSYQRQNLDSLAFGAYILGHGAVLGHLQLTIAGWNVSVGPLPLPFSTKRVRRHH